MRAVCAGARAEWAGPGGAAAAGGATAGAATPHPDTGVSAIVDLRDTRYIITKSRLNMQLTIVC